MINNFRKTVILTSKNPETFLTFNYDQLDGSINIYPYVESSINNSIFFINGIDSAYLDPSICALKLTPDISIATFHLFLNQPQDLNIDFNLKAFDNSVSLKFSLDISILNRPFIVFPEDINTFDNYSPLVDNEISYLLLRTNPIFTGNIKIVVDPSNNLYLDTFKVLESLSKNSYRKQQVSGNGVFANDIRKVFSSLPMGDIYTLDPDSLNISIPKTDLSKQYDQTYSYGASLFEDNLYTQEYSLLAPLWMNSVLPDYFAIFRINGSFNPESYSNTITTTNLADNFFSDSSIVKSWGLSSNTPLGNYLNTHLDDLTQHPSSVFLSLNGFDPNTWYGIAVDKGIITGRSETPYFFQQTIDNFTSMNAFISNGFKRNNLLCPNLINLQFIFDDEDTSMYTMHRYFGLYLSENKLYEIAYYSDTSSGDISLLSLDGNDPSVFFNSDIFDSSGNISSNYGNRIFVLNDGANLIRINNVNQLNGYQLNNQQYLNIPGDNIFSTSVINKIINPYITIKFNDLINQGEQFRVLDKTSGIIWEMCAIDSSCLSAGDIWPWNSIYTSSGYPNL